MADKGKNFYDLLIALVPLAQTLMWASVVLFLCWRFREHLSFLLENTKQRVAEGSSYKVGFIEVGEKLEKLEDDVKIVRDKVERVFLLTMSSPMFYNLKKLAGDGKFGPYRMDSGLRRELYYLREVGYIEVKSITAIPPEGDQLSNYVSITEIGRQFVQLRESAMREEAHGFGGE